MARKLLTPVLLLAAPALFCAELNFICTADLHGAMSRFAELGAAIRQVPEPAVRLDLGDLAQGSFESDHLGGLPMMAMLNALDYHYFVPGNHDFEFPAPVFAAMLRAFNGEVLGANWQWAGMTPRPWVLVEKGGVRAAIIGLTAERQGRRMSPADPGEFPDAGDALERILPQVRAARPDVIVLAWHRGVFSGPISLAKRLHRHAGIDVVLCGHTHQEEPGSRYGRFWFVQPGARAKSAAVVTVTVDDRTRKITSIASRLIRGVPGRADPGLAALVHKFSRQSQAEGAAPLRVTAAELPAAAAQAVARACGAPAALVKLGPLPEASGSLTVKELYRLMPYRNRLCVTRISSGELRQLLEKTAELNSAVAVEFGCCGFTAKLDRRRRLSAFAAPPVLEIALSEYLLSLLPDDPARPVRRTLLQERDVVNAALH